MSYKPPIEATVSTVFEKLADTMEKDIADYASKIILKLGLTVDENELIRALQYDREQYEKGYKDGYLDCLREIDAGDVQELLEKGYHIVNDIPMKPPEVEE